MRIFSLILPLALSLLSISACAPSLDTPNSLASDQPLHQPSAAPTQSPEPLQSPSSGVSETPSVPDGTSEISESATITGIKIIKIPTELKLDAATVALKAVVELSDGSTSDGVLFSVDDASILRLEGGFYLSPRALGTAHVTVRSLKDLSVKEVVEVVVVTAGDDTAVGPDEGSAAATEHSLNAYYRDDYQVGMRWEYRIGLSKLAVNTSGKPVPVTIPLAYGLQILGAAESNLNALLQRVLEQEQDMGRWILEVTAVNENSVTIRSQVVSNSDYLESQEPVDMTYTPENIGTAYTDLMQLSTLEQRQVAYIKSDVSVTSFLNDTGEKVLTDYFEGNSKLASGPLDKEEAVFWFNQELGLVQKSITIKQFSLGYLYTDTTIQISLSSFSG